MITLPWDKLVEDTTISEAGSDFSGFVLAHTCATKEEIGAFVAQTV